MTWSRRKVIGVWALVIAIVLASGFAGLTCAMHAEEPAYEMRTVTLDDGTRVPCLIYHESAGSTSVGGISCDWANAGRP